MAKTKITIQLDLETIKKLDDLADREGRSRSNMIEKLVNDELKALDLGSNFESNLAKLASSKSVREVALEILRRATKDKDTGNNMDSSKNKPEPKE